MTTRQANRNNWVVRWIVAPLFVILAASALTGAVAAAWSLNGRVTANETKMRGVEQRLATIEEHLMELLRRVPPPRP